MPTINLALEAPQVQQIVNVLEKQPHCEVAGLINAIVQQSNAQLAQKPAPPAAVSASPTPAAVAVSKALKKSKTIPLPIGSHPSVP